MAKIPYDKTAEIVQAAREMIAGRDEWECRQERAIVALADENARLRAEGRPVPPAPPCAVAVEVDHGRGGK